MDNALFLLHFNCEKIKKRGCVRMKAVYIENKQLQIGERPKPTIQAGDVLLHIKAAGLNRRDLYTQNRLEQQAPPLILGSDASGIVEEVGAGVTHIAVGDEVIINPSLRWYEQSDVPPDDFEILSLPDDGTFAEYIAISAEQVEKKPAYLNFVEAATLGIAPLTGYRALVTKGAIREGQTVFIPGAGSGVATFMIQFAKKKGARVIVSSRSEAKRQASLAIGADRAVANEEDWTDVLKDETIDLVIESVGRATFNRSLAVLKKGGTVVVFGATTEDFVELDLRTFFYAQQRILGTTLGNREEFREMLQFIEQHQLYPVIDRTFQLEEAEEALQLLEKNQQFGKIVFEMNV